VNSEKSDGRSVSSNAASGLLRVEMGRSTLRVEAWAMAKQRQGKKASLSRAAIAHAKGKKRTQKMLGKSYLHPAYSPHSYFMNMIKNRS